MRIKILLVSVFVLAACATGGTSNANTQRGGGDVITSEELAKVARNDLYAAISQLRPTFLMTRGASSFGGGAPEAVQVYVDGVKRGDLQALRQINVVDVKEVRHLSATEATQRFGTGNTMGAIVVVMRK